jgi:hypothetical protein
MHCSATDRSYGTAPAFCKFRQQLLGSLQMRVSFHDIRL